jgi:subtilisin family serine protease
MNDGSIEDVLVAHANVKGFLRDKWSWGSSLGVYVRVHLRNDIGKRLGSHLVQVRDGNASRQDGIVWVLSGKGRCGLGGKFVQFASGDTGVDALNDLLGNDNRVNVLRDQEGLRECRVRV